jgi:hypothetical protein
VTAIMDAVDYSLAITRLEQKVRYLGTKAETAPDEKARHFALLDKTCFELAIDALKFSRDYAAYENTQPQN